MSAQNNTSINLPVTNINTFNSTNNKAINPTTPNSVTTNSSPQAKKNLKGTDSNTKYSDDLSFCNYPIKIKSNLVGLEETKSVYIKNPQPENAKRYIDELLNSKNFNEANSIFNLNKKNFIELDQEIFKAKLLIASSKFKDGIRILDNANIKFKFPKVITEQLVLEFYKNKNYVDAKTAISDFLKNNKNYKNYDMLEQWCQLEIEDSNYSDAELVCKRLVKVDPKNNLAYIYLGIMHRNLLEYEKALYFFNEANKVKPSEFAHSCIGEIYLKQKNYNKAKLSFIESLKLESNSARAEMALGLIDYYEENFDSSIEKMQKACLSEKSLMPYLINLYNELKANKNTFTSKYYSVIQKCNSI